MDWIAGILELAGLWKIGDKRAWGFLLCIAGGLCWITYVILNGHTYGLLVVVIPALFINVRNYTKWRRDEKMGNKIPR